MSERVKVIIRASHDVLTVQDAMQQVLDFFALLSQSTDEDEGVVWQLVYASTNSPLTVEAEAVGNAPDIDVTAGARAQKLALGKQIGELLQGHRPQAWDGTERASLAMSLIRRSLNGIGETEIVLEPDEPGRVLTLTTAAARLGVEILEERPAFDHSFVAHSERGSLEGHLASIEPFHGKPAIKVEDRRGRRVTCLISTATHDKLVKEVNFDDVWSNRRVVVRGQVIYNTAGRIQRVQADNVDFLRPPREVQLDSIIDPGFTDGLDAVKYLSRLREGELG